jgi:hypothetical protein
VKFQKIWIFLMNGSRKNGKQLTVALPVPPAVASVLSQPSKAEVSPPCSDVN